MHKISFKDKPKLLPDVTGDVLCTSKFVSCVLVIYYWMMAGVLKM